MILTEDVQVQLFRQSAVGTLPGTPNGILVPRGSDFELPYDQGLIENSQVQADGFQRPSGRGNQKVEGAGNKVVPNLNYLPYQTKAWCGQATTTGSSAPYTTVCKPNRATLYYLYELGLIPASLFYRFYDMVTSELHFSLATEGIFEVGQKLVGSGKVSFPPSGTSLDTTPTELVAPTVDYTALTLLENGIDAGDMISMTVDCVAEIVQKRPTGAGAIATELRLKKKKVSGTVKFYFESDARWARVRTGTRTSLRFTVIDTDSNSAIGDMAEVELESMGPKLADSEGVTQEYKFNAVRYANVTDTPIKFTHLNTTATYD
jgi:hypothetical protein